MSVGSANKRAATRKTDNIAAIVPTRQIAHLCRVKKPSAANTNKISGSRRIGAHQRNP
jgi:hypothetical protein